MKKQNREMERDQQLDIKWISERVVINTKIRTLEVSTVASFKLIEFTDTEVTSSQKKVLLIMKL